jgi:hypothetical protein
LIACSTSIIVYNKKNINYSLCHYSNDKTKLKTLEASENVKVKAANAVPVQTGDNDVDSGEYNSLYWEKKKLGCPFCKSFLDSPCESPFKAWYVCVEEVKAKTPPPLRTRHLQILPKMQVHLKLCVHRTLLPWLTASRYTHQNSETSPLLWGEGEGRQTKTRLRAGSICLVLNVCCILRYNYTSFIEIGKHFPDFSSKAIRTNKRV